MVDTIKESIKLNEQIKQSLEYQKYIDAKQALCDNMELRNQLKEFRRRNYELQNQMDYNNYDQVYSLVSEYDEILHNSIVSDYLMAEQQICKMMQKVFQTVAEGLEFDYFDE